MIGLDDSKWKELDGGYRMAYDASVPLKGLEQAITDEETDAVFAELWNELHHQGDVGLASYYAVPHFIRIAKEKNLYNWNVFGLIATIEIARHSNNPTLPEELEPVYLHALQKELPELITKVIADKWDMTMTAAILSSLAVSKGHIEMADAILKMEDEDLPGCVSPRSRISKQVMRENTHHGNREMS
ncbi:MAG TPA: hypothetical protein PKG90_15330 [Chitinophagaceae bacterium]|nr:hypothetical protein [Chitinophagaceae bacterium]